jgi:hypothetical protein
MRSLPRLWFSAEDAPRPLELTRLWHEVASMTDPLSMNPQDEEVRCEITLLTDLMIAANDAAGQVDPDAIDRILRSRTLAGDQDPAPFAPRQRTGSAGAAVAPLRHEPAV